MYSPKAVFEAEDVFLKFALCCVVVVDVVCRLALRAAYILP